MAGKTIRGKRRHDHKTQRPEPQPMLTMDMLVGDYQKRRPTSVTARQGVHAGYLFKPDDAPTFTCQRIGDALILEGVLCAVNADDDTSPAIEFVQKLLRFNLAQQTEHTPCLAYDDKSKQLILYCAMPLRDVTPWQFIESVDAFAQANAHWHDVVQTHQPQHT